MAAAAIVLTPGMAVAAGPRAVQQGYGTVAGAGVAFERPTRAAIAPVHTGALPFTGVDLGLIVAGGGGLVLLGGALKRAAGRE